jgi:hypothetical protein
MPLLRLAEQEKGEEICRIIPQRNPGQAQEIALPTP